MSDFIRRLSTQDTHFEQAIRDVLSWDDSVDESVTHTVRDIIRDVKHRGDAALLEYTQRFDHAAFKTVDELLIDQSQIEAACQNIPAEALAALKYAAQRIRSYHEHQKTESWSYTEADGTVLGQQVRPLERVGLYVPGGKAAYPSSVLMTAITAQVAGVDEVVLVTPTPGGDINPMVLAAASLAGVDKVFCVGGAQAVAALAYGTETLPKVDKIVGPGNIYVATAKREVFGQVDIDMIAGPSEILVVSDGKTSAEWVAMDLFSQAEHDEQAQAILVSPDAEFLNAVEDAMKDWLPKLDRQEIALASLKARGALIHVSSMDEAMSLVNRIAPEHLELSMDQPEQYLPRIRHAGAIFMGRYTSESLGDYCAGPNHVLPTAGTARFSSPLGVYDFMKRSSVIYCSEAGAREQGKYASILARSESLQAHALAAELRLEKNE